MGKTSKWLKSLLTSKEKEKCVPPTKTKSAPISVPSPKDNKRWSFRRSVAGGKESGTVNLPATANRLLEAENEQEKHAMALAVATAAAADAAVAAAQAAAEVVRLTVASNTSKTSRVYEVAAVIKIQTYFRSYLARKALYALRGIVTLQAIVRGHLVRRQATETLGCVQALVAAQVNACARRIQAAEEAQAISQRQPNNRRSPQRPRFRQSYEMEKNVEENIKIVEMDHGEPRRSSKGRNSYSVAEFKRTDYSHSTCYYGARTPSKTDIQQQYSPCPSTLTEISPKTRSGHFEEFSFATAQSSPQYFSAISVADTNCSSIDHSFYPNYMANTESSRAKARSQSAPRQRLDSYERQPSRRRPSVEGRNIPRGVKMQRSSSHVGVTAGAYQFPCSLKLDESNMNFNNSECGSTCTVLTNSNYCRSLASYEVYGNNY